MLSSAAVLGLVVADFDAFSVVGVAVFAAMISFLEERQKHIGGIHWYYCLALLHEPLLRGVGVAPCFPCFRCCLDESLWNTGHDRPVLFSSCFRPYFRCDHGGGTTASGAAVVDVGSGKIAREVVHDSSLKMKSLQEQNHADEAVEEAPPILVLEPR